MRASDVPLPLTALLGGSFNPPHIGHFRLALEVREALRPERLLFLPSAIPPHKPSHDLLPFDLRVHMLREVLRGLPDMEVCTIENERPGPSYTVDTLLALSALYPKSRLAFIIGGEDLPLLPSWDRWELLTELAEFIVLPRGNADKELIASTIRTQWPGARTEAVAPASVYASSGNSPENGLVPDMIRFHLPGGGRILYLDRPRLEVRSSTLRERWLKGHRLDFLLPPTVLDLMEENRDTVSATWSNASF